MLPLAWHQPAQGERSSSATASSPRRWARAPPNSPSDWSFAWDDAHRHGGIVRRRSLREIHRPRDRWSARSRIPGLQGGPSHVTGNGIARACEASLTRLGTDHLDLYLLHWPNGVTDL